MHAPSDGQRLPTETLEAIAKALEDLSDDDSSDDDSDSDDSDSDDDFDDVKVGRKLVKDMKVAELKEALESRLDGSEIPDKRPRKAELIKLLQRTVRRDAKKKKAKKAKKSSRPAAQTNDQQEQEREEQEQRNPSQMDDTMDMDVAETQDIDEEPSAEQDGEGSVIAGRVEADPYGDAYGEAADANHDGNVTRSETAAYQEDGAATSSDEEDGDAMEVVQDFRIDGKTLKSLKVAQLRDALHDRLDPADLPPLDKQGKVKWPKKADLIKMLENAMRKQAATAKPNSRSPAATLGDAEKEYGGGAEAAGGSRMVID